MRVALLAGFGEIIKVKGLLPPARPCDRAAVATFSIAACARPALATAGFDQEVQVKTRFGFIGNLNLLANKCLKPNKGGRKQLFFR